MTDSVKRPDLGALIDPTFKETLHGIEVADPYRAFENFTSTEVLTWVDANNDHTQDFVDGAVDAKRLETVLEKAFDYPRSSMMVKRGNRYFWSYNSGLQPQAIHCYKDGENGATKTLYDPNLEDKDGRISVQSVTISPNGKYAAIQTMVDGKDASIIRIFDIEEGEFLTETLDHCRYASVVWMPDESGFIYDQYFSTEDIVKNQTTGEDEVKNTRGRKPFVHKLKTPQCDDTQPIPHEGTDMLFVAAQKIAGSDEFFVYKSTVGTSRDNGLVLSRFDDPTKVFEITPPGKMALGVIGFHDGKLYCLTSNDAPNSKIVAIDPLKPAPENWETIIEENPSSVVIDGFFAGEGENKKLYVSKRLGLTEKFEIYSPQGEFKKEIDLPEPCAMGYIAPQKGDTTFPFQLHTYLGAPSEYEFDITTDTYRLTRTSECPHTLADDCEVSIIMAPSRADDKKRVPMAVIHKKDVKLDGSTPALVTAYGGFNVPQTPAYSTTMFSWVKQGGVWAVAGIRGGTEYGKNWWKEGSREYKENCFDDMAGCLDALHAKGFSSPEKTAIRGGSNGGLLVGACLNRYPGLFSGAICAVPVIDMLRFHKKFTPASIGFAWASDYGNPDIEADFKTALKYSPLHNIRRGEKYPHTLIMTADSDTRVEPLHAYKFAAALHTEADPSSPVFLHTERHAGHGAGKSVKQMAHEIAFTFGFLERALGRLPTPHALEASLAKKPAGRKPRLPVARP